MLVYSPTITPRLRYISDFIGQQLTGQPLLLTSDKQEFLRHSDAKINYSDDPFGQPAIWVKPHTLLFENTINPQAINILEVEDQKAFFKTGGDSGFDIFAASFYLLSRYEEYLPHQKDMYGRYAHDQSLAFRENFLIIPLVNKWIMNFQEKIQKHFPNFPFREPVFTFLPTYDIDEAFSFKHKTAWRNTGGTIKDLFKGNWKNFHLRRDVIHGKQADPFDSYEWLNKMHDEHKLSPLYFFLVAGKNGKYDRNILPTSPVLQRIIREHAKKYRTGIHPSWQTGDNPSLIRDEMDTLAALTGKHVTASRQHYIRFNLPATFRQLIEAGITNDYSMGYGSINGFRASIASPFFWYDLEKNESTKLLLWPFCYMDANSFFEQRMSPAMALEEMRHYYQVVREVSGTYISIWHNTFLGTSELFSGWRETYQQFVKETTG